MFVVYVWKKWQFFNANQRFGMLYNEMKLPEKSIVALREASFFCCVCYKRIKQAYSPFVLSSL